MLWFPILFGLVKRDVTLDIDAVSLDALKEVKTTPGLALFFEEWGLGLVTSVRSTASFNEETHLNEQNGAYTPNVNTIVSDFYPAAIILGFTSLFFTISILFASILLICCVVRSSSALDPDDVRDRHKIIVVSTASFLVILIFAVSFLVVLSVRDMESGLSNAGLATGTVVASALQAAVQSTNQYTTSFDTLRVNDTVYMPFIEQLDANMDDLINDTKIDFAYYGILMDEFNNKTSLSRQGTNIMIEIDDLTNQHPQEYQVALQNLVQFDNENYTLGSSIYSLSTHNASNPQFSEYLLPAPYNDVFGLSYSDPYNSVLKLTLPQRINSQIERRSVLMSNLNTSVQIQLGNLQNEYITTLNTVSSTENLQGPAAAFNEANATYNTSLSFVPYTTYAVLILTFILFVCIILFIFLRRYKIAVCCISAFLTISSLSFMIGLAAFFFAFGLGNQCDVLTFQMVSTLSPQSGEYMLSGFAANSMCSNGVEGSALVNNTLTSILFPKGYDSGLLNGQQVVQQYVNNETISIAPVSLPLVLSEDALRADATLVVDTLFPPLEIQNELDPAARTRVQEALDKLLVVANVTVSEVLIREGSATSLEALNDFESKSGDAQAQLVSFLNVYEQVEQWQNEINRINAQRDDLDLVPLPTNYLEDRLATLENNIMVFKNRTNVALNSLLGNITEQIQITVQEATQYDPCPEIQQAAQVTEDAVCHLAVLGINGIWLGLLLHGLLCMILGFVMFKTQLYFGAYLK